MQLSIGKLVTVLVILLITVTIVTTGVSLLAVQRTYRTLETRHEAGARDTAHNAALAIHNQLRFYQGIVQRIASNPGVGNPIEFDERPSAVEWSQAVSRLLPGTLGIALGNADGVIFGDPLALRVGPACQADLRHFASGEAIDYPLLHTDVPGFEHFDLVAPIAGQDDEQVATLFVSFRLDLLRASLSGMMSDGDRFVLHGADDTAKLSVGHSRQSSELQRFSAPVPDSPWRVELYRPVPNTGSLLAKLILTDGLILAVAGLLIATLVRVTLSRFKTDMQRIHHALEQVLAGDYEPLDAPTAIKETSILLPDIEQLALRIQRQRDGLRKQSLSDSLTAVYNRRYFDLMLVHHHAQSRRQSPAVLILIDLNDFKQINDNHGHGTGDRVLRASAEFLRSRVRETDIVARIGGDEFAVILNQMTDIGLDGWLAHLVGDYDETQNGVAGQDPPHCTFSVGAAFIDARHYHTAPAVFHAADDAMYAVKQQRHQACSRYAIAQHHNVTSLKVAQDPP